MKNMFLTLGGVIIMASANAQASADSVANTTKIKNKFKVETNGFFSNWFLGAGVGAQVFYADHNGMMDFKDRITPAYEFYFGKWFTPGLGIRGAVNGLKVHGLTQNGSHSTGEMYDAVNNLKREEFQYVHVHADVMANVSQMIGGYKEDRFYSLIPYFGLGLMHTWEKPTSREISASLGIYNTFRLSDPLNLTLDVRGSLVNDRFDGEVGKRREEGILTAAVGLAYNFKKRNWDQTKETQIVQTNNTELNLLKDKVNKLVSDNDILKKQLAEAKQTSITDVKIENHVLVAPILVTFNIDKTDVSNEARVNLGFFADMIKKGNSNIVYTITGYADKGTGSVKRNEYLSKNRAQNIYDVLVNEFNVSPSQLKVKHEGGVDNMFYDDPRVSRAVIVLGK